MLNRNYEQCRKNAIKGKSDKLRRAILIYSLKFSTLVS